jgi:AcrR family transcriptional regulator
MATRKYELKKRAVKKRRTRERIVEATVALHQEIGPGATTISGIAERAGVQRLTVYRHFPTERDLLAACSSNFIDRHPPPGPVANETLGADEQTRAVLQAFYKYYGETSDMWASIYRDKNRMATVAEVMEGFETHLETVEKYLQAAWAPRRSKRLHASIGHALHFSTWQSLDSLGLNAREMAALVSTWVAASA